MGTQVPSSPIASALEAHRLGYFAVALSNWLTDGLPQVIGNVEVDGDLYSFQSLESITGLSGLSNGVIYVKAVPSGASVTVEYTSTAPTWNDAKQGWYSPTVGQESHRYLFSAVKVDSTHVSTKREMEVRRTVSTALLADNSTLACGIDFVNGNAGTYGSQSIAFGADWVIPKGTYLFAARGNQVTDYLMFQIKDGSGSWIVGGSYQTPSLIVTDGINYRIHNYSASGSSTLYYRKLA